MLDMRMRVLTMKGRIECLLSSRWMKGSFEALTLPQAMLPLGTKRDPAPSAIHYISAFASARLVLIDCQISEAIHFPRLLQDYNTRPQ